MKILDCTLRDGGYYTKWFFDESFVEAYLSIVKNIGVDVVELGYLNFDESPNGDFYALSNQEINRIKSKLRNNQKIAVMIDAKKFKTNSDFAKLKKRLISLSQIGSYVIRVTASQSDAPIVYKIGKAVVAAGHEYSINLMYLHQYIEKKENLKEFIETSKLCTYVCLVDSYGACLPSQVKNIVQFAKKIFDCAVGFHGHNNMELVTANALAAVEAGVDVLDSTFDGMGRGAGNLRTEAALLILNKFSYSRQMDQYYLARIEELMSPIKVKYGWGAKFPYLYTGVNKLPQSVVMELFEAKRYSVLDVYNLINLKISEADTKKVKPISGSDILVLIGDWQEIYRSFDKVKHLIDSGYKTIIIGINAFHNFRNLFKKRISGNVKLVVEDFDYWANEKMISEYRIDEIFINNLSVKSPKANIKKIITTKTKGNLLEAFSLLLGKNNSIEIFGLSGFDSSGHINYTLLNESQNILNQIKTLNKVKILGPTNYV